MLALSRKVLALVLALAMLVSGGAQATLSSGGVQTKVGAADAQIVRPEHRAHHGSSEHLGGSAGSHVGKHDHNRAMRDAPRDCLTVCLAAFPDRYLKATVARLSPRDEGAFHPVTYGSVAMLPASVQLKTLTGLARGPPWPQAEVDNVDLGRSLVLTTRRMRI